MNSKCFLRIVVPSVLRSSLLCSFILVSTGNSVFADAGATPYSFGGACGSQGVWTQSALEGARSLRKITEQLRDDPNCKALGASTVASIEKLQNSVSTVSDSSNRTTRLAQIPYELEALRTFQTGDAALKEEVLKLMMNRSIEQATLSAQVAADNASAGGPGVLPPGDYGDRIRRGTQVGIQTMTEVIDALPQLDQCLMGDGQQAIGQFMASAIQVATSLASSGQDATGSQMAKLVSKLSTVARDRKFSRVLRTLNHQEFQASMTCLLEITSESYCQARDAMGLFQDGMKNIKWRNDQGKVASTNPLIGHYVLNTHVPNVTKWMQKVQIGVDPKLPTDAQFQNRIQQEVVDFYKNVKTLKGDYNSKLETIKGQTTLAAQQNEARNLIIGLADTMASTYPGMTNFFTMTKAPVEIPFFLLEMEIPDIVSGKQVGSPPQDFRMWLQMNYKSLPKFATPLELAISVGKKMDELILESNFSAIAYFSRWYIVDKQALVNEALTDVNYTVKDSLIVIRDYLDIVKGRIQKSGDASLVSSIMDTQHRINSILRAFDKIENVGKKFAEKVRTENLTELDIMEASQAAAELINITFDKFMVMQARSGFLANRLTNFVYQDYIQLINSKENFSEKQQEIFIQTGMAALDRMLQMYNGNPANIQSDLNMALSVNKTNLQALDQLLKDSLINQIANLKASNEGKTFGRGAAINSAIRDAQREDVMTHMTAPFSVFAMVRQWFTHSDRYSTRGNTKVTPQSEFSENQYVQAQICVQSLAFYNQAGIVDLCRGTVLYSPFKDVVGYDIAYNDRLKSGFDNLRLSPPQRASLNHSERICAFRDFNRKNMVLFMSINKK